MIDCIDSLCSCYKDYYYCSYLNQLYSFHISSLLSSLLISLLQVRLHTRLYFHSISTYYWSGDHTFESFDPSIKYGYSYPGPDSVGVVVTAFHNGSPLLTIEFFRGKRCKFEPFIRIFISLSVGDIIFPLQLYIKRILHSCSVYRYIVFAKIMYIIL